MGHARAWEVHRELPLSVQQIASAVRPSGSPRGGGGFDAARRRRGLVHLVSSGLCHLRSQPASRAAIEKAVGATVAFAGVKATGAGVKATGSGWLGPGWVVDARGPVGLSVCQSIRLLFAALSSIKPASKGPVSAQRLL